MNGALAPTVAIPTRRLSFEESLRELPRHFAADEDLITSHLMAALSAVFPEGEKFFVRSVQHFRHRITDPELKRQVAGFSGQEAMHARAHRALNERLAELGYPTRRFDRRTKWALELQSRWLSPMANLAVTAALEHFTATLAELLLGDEEARGWLGHEEIKKMFLWHALEESEHKAVSFDVYRALGGSERLRVRTMRWIRWGFMLSLLLQVVVSMLADRDTWRWGRLRRTLRRLRRAPYLRREIWQQLRDYDRPDFHPNDRDTTALIERWRRELFGERGSMSDRLVGAAA
jgi:predicted metal-dependent hydrolase